MKRRKFTRPVARLLLCCLLLNLALLLTACGGASAAAAMHLKKAEGAVGVTDGEGNDVALAENLGLYSGYTVTTKEESYAWIDLDKVKLAKLDADSTAEIVQEDKHLTVNVQTGSLFFNVSEPLADDETMEIATSSMLVGIRGTCGWVTQNTAALLEGTVTVTAGEQAVTVNAGEMAVLTENGVLEITAFSTFSVPVFVWTEITEDEALTEEVLEATGMDLAQNPPVPRYAEAMIAEELDEVLYTEWIDLAKDGDPELLVIGIQNHETDSPYMPVRHIYLYIFSSEDVQYPLYGRNYMNDGIPLYAEAPPRGEGSCSLVEADGRYFLEVYHSYYHDTRGGTVVPELSEFVYYYGFDADGYWFSEYTFFSYNYFDNEDVINGSHGLRFFAPGKDDEHWECGPDEFAATRAKYTLIKTFLYSPDDVTVTVVAS